MEVVRFDDAGAFLTEAGPFLLADEARHNLMLGIAGNARDGLYEDVRLWLVRHDGLPVAAALQTPPNNLVLARPHSRTALSVLAEALATADAPGVVGAAPEVDEFVELWRRRTGADVRASMRQGIFALDRAEPLPAAPGTARVATADDQELALRWWLAFAEEVHQEGAAVRDRAEAMIDFRLSSPTAGILLWEDGGDPVSLAGWGGPTPNGIRVGPVYTPPELRGRGYATALTAELSLQLLDGRIFEGGRRFCFLYTDLANPTSNAIYERIGYRRVAESAEIVFG